MWWSWNARNYVKYYLIENHDKTSQEVPSMLVYLKATQCSVHSPAPFSSHLPLLLVYSLYRFPLPFLKLFPFFLECLRHSTFFPPTNPLRHGQKKYYRKRDDTEHGEDKQGENGRRQKPKLEGKGKGEDTCGKGRTGDKARNSDPIK